MDAAQACKIIMECSGFGVSLGTSIIDSGVRSSVHDYGKFYGSNIESDPLGVGQIHQKIRIPIYNVDDDLFDTKEGVVYVLSHECDISQDNNRLFNDYLLICPIIDLEHILKHLIDMLGNDSRISGFLMELGRDRIFRLLYFPPIASILPYGGVIYLNQITHTHINAFMGEENSKLSTLSGYGLNVVDYKIKNHLFREKVSTALF